MHNILCQKAASLFMKPNCVYRFHGNKNRVIAECLFYSSFWGNLQEQMMPRYFCFVQLVDIMDSLVPEFHHLHTVS